MINTILQKAHASVVVGVVFGVEMSRLYVYHQFSFSAFASYMICRLKTSSLLGIML